MSKNIDAADVKMLFEFPRIIHQLHRAFGGQVTDKLADFLGDEPDSLFDPLSDEFNFGVLYATETGLFYELGYRQNKDKILCGLTLSLEADSDDVDVFETSMSKAAQEWTGWMRELAKVDDEDFVFWHRTLPIDDFIGQNKPVEAIEKFFLLCLDELKALKKKYPAIPWS